MRPICSSAARVRGYILLLSTFIGACALKTEDAGETEDALGKKPPIQVLTRDVSAGPDLFYRETVNAHPVAGKRWVLFSVAGTPGDEVELLADGHGSDTVLVVLGDRDPGKIATCEQLRGNWGEAQVAGCLEFVGYPVLASNDDLSASSQSSRIRTKLHSSKLQFAVSGAYSLAVTATNVVSAIDTTTCKSGWPGAGSFGPFSVVTHVRDCTGAKACGAWREEGQRRPGAAMKATFNAAEPLFWLTDSAGPFRTVGHGLSNSGMATTRDCTVDTRCTVAAGAVSCEPYKKAVVLHHGATAVDSDTCTFNQSSTPTWRGVLGPHCASLASSIQRSQIDGATRETEQVIVETW